MQSFTATMAVKLLSEKFPELGEAVLDIPIRKLVPSFNFTLSDRYDSMNSTSSSNLICLFFLGIDQNKHHSGICCLIE